MPALDMGSGGVVRRFVFRPFTGDTSRFRWKKHVGIASARLKAECFTNARSNLQTVRRSLDRDFRNAHFWNESNRMSQDSLRDIEKLEKSLWAAADQLRSNSGLASSEYCMPVLGIIFLRHATNRYNAACRQIAEEQAAGKMAKRPPIKADFLKRRALLLPKEARYDELLKLPKGTNLGAAIVAASRRRTANPAP